MIKIKSYVKINLYLNILDHNPTIDKHKISSVFFLYKKMYDVIYIRKNPQLSILYKDYYNGDMITFDNDLVKKIIDYFIFISQIPVEYEFIIKKKVRSGSGLGSGSSNAATVFSFLCKKNNFIIKDEHLEFIAKYIGSDIPFFIKKHKVAVVSSYGEEVQRIKNKWKIISVIENPLYSETKLIYNDFKKKKKEKSSNVWNFVNNDINPNNDLQSVFFQKYPNYEKMFNSIIISDNTKKILSGSGSSFVLFKRKENIWK